MRWAILTAAAVALLLAAGCTVGHADAGEGAEPKLETSKSPAPGGAVPAAAELPAPTNDFAAALAMAIPVLPQDTAILVAIDLKMIVRLLEVGFLGPLIKGALDDKLLGELSKLFQQRLGFDPLAARTALVFAALDGNYGGVLVTGTFKITAGNESVKEVIEEVDCVKLKSPRVFVVPVKGVGIALFESRGQAGKYVKNVLKAKAVDVKPGRLGELSKLASSNPYAWLSSAVQVQGTKLERKWEEPSPILRPDRAVFHLTPGLVVADVHGSQDCLDSIVKAIVDVRTKARDAVSKARVELDSYPLVGAAGILVADHMLESTFDAFMPKRGDGFLHFEISADAAGLSSIGGILAAVAVPAFIKYQRKAKTAEAIDYLDRIYKGAADYFATPRINNDTYEKLPCQFPASQPVTPAAGTCCKSLGGPDADGDNRCDVQEAPGTDAEVQKPELKKAKSEPKKGKAEAKKGQMEPVGNLWDTPTWSALYFQITEPHYFVYEFTSNGKTGNDAEFVATAYGDLDCDGIRSTFQRSGRGEEVHGECYVLSAAALFVQNETE